MPSRLRAFGSDLLEARGVEWSVEAPPGGLHPSVPPDVRRQLYLVFKEGIHNIEKHSDATKARLRLEVQDGHIRGELSDDGCGIAADRTHGNGCASMRARVEQLAGFIDIAPASDGGTRIRIDVPFAKRT